MKPQEFKEITYQCDEATGIVTLTLNIPARKNALSGYTMHELFHAAQWFDQDEAASVMIITGAVDPDNPDPRAHYFSSGGYYHPHDLSAHKLDITEDGLIDLNQTKLITRLITLKKPVIAALNGCAIGAGITLPLVGADLIYASDLCTIDFRFVKIGMTPELSSSYLLPKIVGLQKAKELVYFGQKITAQEAEPLGIINGVVAHDELLDYCRERALELIPPRGVEHAIRRSKQAFNAPYIAEIEETLKFENKGLNQCLSQPDMMEALLARIEKRDPVFRGEVDDPPPFELPG